MNALQENIMPFYEMRHRRHKARVNAPSHERFWQGQHPRTKACDWGLEAIVAAEADGSIPVHDRNGFPLTDQISRRVFLNAMKRQLK